MTHPSYPYRDEESRDIQKCVECMGSMADVRRIRKIWKERRDFEFPGWMSVYDQQFAEWLKQTD